jgi:EF-P beta-lysylation protein EpmB
MVPRSVAACQTSTWKQELAEAYRHADDLIAGLRLRRDQIPDLDPEPPGFRILVPRAFAALMTPGDPHDPLLRQVLPLCAERQSVSGFIPDPVGDASADSGDGLLQKYEGRALLLATGACALHCRYCFRRHFPYSSLGPVADRIPGALSRIAADTRISEVILSGGDPLMIDDDALGVLIQRLGDIPHIRRLHIHTRLPVVIPSRVTQDLCDLLAAARPAVLVVIHANHPRELGSEAQRSLLRLHRAGLRILNQSVLLRGVNDRAEILHALSERLFDCSTLPYYLHQLDPVQGASHFEVPDTHALELLETLRRGLPGYLVPHLVREMPGAESKIPLIAFTREGRSSTSYQ